MKELIEAKIILYGEECRHYGIRSLEMRKHELLGYIGCALALGAITNVDARDLERNLETTALRLQGLR